MASKRYSENAGTHVQRPVGRAESWSARKSEVALDFEFTWRPMGRSNYF